MQHRASALTLILALAASSAFAQPGGGGASPLPNGQCPPGMTLVRPDNCRGPAGPVPSILDYRPKSMLKTAEHPRMKAKFPVIDYHGHPRNLVDSDAGLASLAASMDSLNLRMMIVAENVSGERLKAMVARIAASPIMKDRARVLTGISFRGAGGPGWVEETVKQLEADAAAGAVGVGEIGKGFGQTTRKADGTRLRVNDPILKPIWDACARLNLAVFIHTADPEAFYLPHDWTNERWLEMALFPGRAISPEVHPNFAEVMAERDSLFKANPKTKFVAAHMGWHAHDLTRLGKMLDEMPNVYTEMGAVLYDIGRQPRAAHDFFIKYQDRILFGKDAFEPEEYPYYWRVFETRDDYFDYYRPYHAFWKLYGIDLPDAVLKKIYYQNALNIMPAVPRTGFPR